MMPTTAYFVRRRRSVSITLLTALLACSRGQTPRAEAAAADSAPAQPTPTPVAAAAPESTAAPTPAPTPKPVPAARHPAAASASIGVSAATAPPSNTPPAAKGDTGFVQSNPATRTATFKLVAGYTPLNGALNFDGYRDGDLTLTVPTGWTVVVYFSNHDGMLAHSAEVIAEQHPLPAASVPAGIARAYSNRLDEGIPPQASESFRFTAQPAGSYLIICGVPGHALAGMWIRLVVSDEVIVPEVRSKE